MTDESKSATTFFTDFDFIEFAVLVFDDNSFAIVSREGSELQHWVISGGRVQFSTLSDRVFIGKAIATLSGGSVISKSPLVEVQIKACERPLQFEAKTFHSGDIPSETGWTFLPDWAFTLLREIVHDTAPTLLSDHLYFIASLLEEWLSRNSNAVEAMREYSIVQLRDRGRSDPRNTKSLERIMKGARVVLERPIAEALEAVHTMNSPHVRLQAYKMLKNSLTS